VFKTKDKIVLGIDPGTNVLGYGIIQVSDNQMSLISLGVVKLDKIKDPHLKLKRIYERTKSLIKSYHPNELAIEQPFYGKNIQSMLKLGRAQGVAIAAAITEHIPIYEYAPKKIKQSITGNGNASKEQVAGMLKNLLKFDKSPKFLDATDGLAVAVCHHFQANRIRSSEKNYNNWTSFVAANPDKVV